MTEEDEEAAEGEPTVQLGDGSPVDGAPIARIAARLSWPQERSAIVATVGEERIRTPDGGRELEDILAETDVTYFATRNEFLTAVRSVIGHGPIPTDG